MPDTKTTHLINIQDNLEAYTQRLKDAKTAVEALKAEQALLLAQGQANSAQYEKNAAQLRYLTEVQKNAQKQVDNAVRANKAEKGSYEELYQAWKNAEIELKTMGSAYVKLADGTVVLSDKFKQQSKVVNDAKMALDSFGKAVHNNKLNVGNYSEAIDGAIGKFQMMPGVAGQAATAVGSVNTAFKAMLANPIIAAIAAIIAVFAGLFKVFKSTAEGAAKIKDIFAEVRAVMGILRDRAISLIDAFGHLFKGEWKEAGQAFKETVASISAEMYLAIGVAQELAKAQRDLTREMTAHISEEAKEQKKMSELLFLSRDKTKSDKERMQFLKDFLALEKEQSIQEEEFADRQFDLDIKTLANEKQVDAERLKQWVMMDTMQQELALEAYSDLQEIYNKIGGQPALEKLEQSYAKTIAAQKEFFDKSKRGMAMYSTLQLDLIKEAEAREKARNDALKKQMEDNIKLRLLQAGDDTEKMKEALRFQYEELSKQTGISETQKQILKSTYDNAIAEIDKKDKKEEADRQKEHIKKMNDLEIRKHNAIYGRAQILAGKNLDELEKNLDAEWNAYKKTAEFEAKIREEQLYDEEKYNEAKKELSKARVDMERQALSDVAKAMGQMSQVFGEETAAGKVFAIAEATINMFLAASQALADYSTKSPLAKLAAVATVLAEGAMLISKIKSVVVPGHGSSGGSETSANAIPVNHAVAPSAQSGSNIFTQPNVTPSQAVALQNESAMTYEGLVAALQKMPNPIVTVEDINVRTKAKNKVEVRATI